MVKETEYEKQIRESSPPETNEKREQQKISLIQDYLVLFGCDEGTRVLYDIMKNCYMLKPTYDPDPMLSARNEGKREAALQILTIINFDIGTLLKRLEAQIEKERGNVH